MRVAMAVGGAGGRTGARRAARADLKQALAEPNLEKRSQLALNNATAAYKAARAAYEKGENDQVAAGSPKSRNPSSWHTRLSPRPARIRAAARSGSRRPKSTRANC